MTGEKIKENFDIFFRRKPALMLVALKKIARARYGSILAKEVDWQNYLWIENYPSIKLIKETDNLKVYQVEKYGEI